MMLTSLPWARCPTQSRAARLCVHGGSGGSTRSQVVLGSECSATSMNLVPEQQHGCHGHNRSAGSCCHTRERPDTLGLTPGDHLHLHVMGTRLVLQKPRDAVAELRALGAGVARTRSLVDELLAERRLEADAE